MSASCIAYDKYNTNWTEFFQQYPTNAYMK